MVLYPAEFLPPFSARIECLNFFSYCCFSLGRSVFETAVILSLAWGSWGPRPPVSTCCPHATGCSGGSRCKNKAEPNTSPRTPPSYFMSSDGGLRRDGLAQR